ncbi:BBE domain-containing protein [Promicromonospora xylanilytica]
MPRIDRRQLLAAAPVAGAALLAGGRAAGAAPAADPGTAPVSASRPGPLLVRPDDPRYPELTVGNNQRWVSRPDHVVVAVSPQDVVSAVRDAVGTGRRLAVRSGGHCYEDFVHNAETDVVLDLSELRAVGLDAGERAFFVEPGATLLQVYESLYRRWGVTIPGGSCYSVGAGGHIMGGGYGLLSRRHGLTVDHLHGVDVVVVGADRSVRQVRATRTRHRDLWWAHTGGGGGNFGVVTRYLLRSPGDPADLLPRPPSTVLLRAVAVDWAGLDRDRFVRLVGNYGRWHEANSGPDAAAGGLSAILALNHSSAGAVALLAQTDGDEAGAAERIDRFFTEVLGGVGLAARPVTEPVLEIGALPELAEARRLPWLHAVRLLGTNTPALTDPTRRADHKAAYFRRGLTGRQAAVLHDHLTGAAPANPDAGVVLFGYGGRINAVDPTATAVAQRDSVLKLLVQSFWTDPGDDDANVRWTRELYRDLFADTGGVPVPGDVTDGCYINYPDTDLGDERWNTSGVPWSELYYKQNYQRLQQVKRRWDPTNTFRHAQSVALD